MSSAGRAATSSGCVTTPKEREIGLSGFAAQIRFSSFTGNYGMATAEHREPCESRGSRTVLGAPGGISPPGAPRTVREPLDSHGSRCSAVGIRGQRLCLVHGLLPLPDGFSWPVASVEQCSPFAPAPLQDLHHYYGLLRPCAPHRYSRPHGFSRLRLLPLHRCDRFSRSIQEPGWASRRLHAGYRSGRLQGSPELIPEDGSVPGFDIV